MKELVKSFTTAFRLSTSHLDLTSESLHPGGMSKACYSWAPSKTFEILSHSEACRVIIRVKESSIRSLKHSLNCSECLLTKGSI